MHKPIERREISVDDTRVIQTRLVMPGDSNAHHTLYGGNLMQMIDSVAAISFQRHVRTTGVTAAIDRINFIAPLLVGHSVCIESMVSGVGETSVEIFVKVIGEDLTSSQRYLAATAFLIFVITDRSHLPLPKVKATTAEEVFILEGYDERQAQRAQQRQRDADFQSHISIKLPWKKGEDAE